MVTDTNPKTIAGQSKPSLALIPGPALVEIAQAFEDGARKYNSFNWREKSVPSMTYVNAALRHMYAWIDGEERSKDADVHHLAHAAACFCILLDAQIQQSLIDDRPTPGKSAEAIERGTERNLSKANEQGLQDSAGRVYRGQRHRLP